MPRIIFCAGGTAGSVTPLLAAATVVRHQPETEMVFIGTYTGPERRLIEEQGYRFKPIMTGKLRRYWTWKNIFTPFQLLTGWIQSMVFIVHWNPDVIVSAGSFVGVPVMWAGWLLRRPLVVHQQDASIGLADRLTVRLASKVTVALPENAARFGQAGIYVGNPVRFSPDTQTGSVPKNPRPVIAWLGGGTGAQCFNDFVRENLDALLKEYEIIHSTGGRGELPAARPGYRVEPFISDMQSVYQQADIVIARAGLGTISELAAFGKPSIIIPMPDTHQEANAQYLAQRQMALVITQDNLNWPYLNQQLQSILNDVKLRTTLSKNLRWLYRPDAAARFAEVIVKAAR